MLLNVEIQEENVTKKFDKKERELLYDAKEMEQKCSDAFMEGYRYAIRILQDAIGKQNEAE